MKTFQSPFLWLPLLAAVVVAVLVKSVVPVVWPVPVTVATAVIFGLGTFAAVYLVLGYSVKPLPERTSAPRAVQMGGPVEATRSTEFEELLDGRLRRYRYPNGWPGKSEILWEGRLWVDLIRENGHFRYLQVFDSDSQWLWAVNVLYYPKEGKYEFVDYSGHGLGFGWREIDRALVHGLYDLLTSDDLAGSFVPAELIEKIKATRPVAPVAN